MAGGDSNKRTNPLIVDGQCAARWQQVGSLVTQRWCCDARECLQFGGALAGKSACPWAVPQSAESALRQSSRSVCRLWPHGERPAGCGWQCWQRAWRMVAAAAANTVSGRQGAIRCSCNVGAAGRHEMGPLGGWVLQIRSLNPDALPSAYPSVKATGRRRARPEFHEAAAAQQQHRRTGFGSAISLLVMWSWPDV